ncbi:MAG: branched-chain amino acid ABC transporter permease [Pseudomonadota bacterium]
MRSALLYLGMAAALAAVGVFQSWNVALAILNMCLISAVMALGVNISWGYAGLFNVGTMGFAALGGVAVVLISMPPVGAAWTAGGALMLLAGIAVMATAAAVVYARRRLTGRARTLTTWGIVCVGYVLARLAYTPGASAIEAVDPAATGYLGGLGLPVILAWAAGGLLAAGAAWVIGRISLGLRSDYLAIATLGIAEILIFMMKNEDWLTRGVKNVTGLPRPVPYEVDLREATWLVDLAAQRGMEPATLAAIVVKLGYTALFATVLLVLYTLAERALHSPWGRMMRAIRDNRDAAAAMGKDVTARHLQVFVLGSAVVGIAGAMLTTLDGQFTPVTYNPLRFTFLIWVMVIVGGSGNNRGAILGGFLIWFLWIEVETAGPYVMGLITERLDPGSLLHARLTDAGPHLRLFLMGLLLLLVLRFAPRGLIPEESGRR